MRHITATVKRLEEGGAEAERAGSLVECILKQHSDPKMAAVLALDLFLVGVDTVSQFILHEMASRGSLTSCIWQTWLKSRPTKIKSTRGRNLNCLDNSNSNAAALAPRKHLFICVFLQTAIIPVDPQII